MEEEENKREGREREKEEREREERQREKRERIRVSWVRWRDVQEVIRGVEGGRIVIKSSQVIASPHHILHVCTNLSRDGEHGCEQVGESVQGL
jgi:SepF-like predicted cell division protein (DUF552 family)